MGSPIAIASALAQLVTIKCPWCGHKKLVSRKAAAFRVCPRCKKHFPDPLAKRK
jgi:DNA-directed RNA polymerase subunit RPC12/RpoP